ncbi:MAG: quinone-dependent dihydroorotate dehydrogenase [Candidatus Magasanikbacteria bacterium CG10_big_fil_rev_8_21_14_0_10_43_6]|uniref:Dihydroorotate dehydrogenase (quinone) n=1 Tax=Candidatus Magasanikbacteria bacterium CG10_big_fil_rev_8_21_14_0_10_43_6 TaxID=1974650 RepID=A0A2M6W082_9BACT|nr:MAG: quinone-dependent dihydroorotate dehydrogenase [Candidatus Magasanikbacteria bacterium CG10_big_fil_rev_8_21_14_0_10_43_6]
MGVFYVLTQMRERVTLQTMHTPILHIRNRAIRLVYQYILKPIFFRIDPEITHDRMTRVGMFLGKRPFTRFLIRACLSSPHSNMLSQRIAGIHFANPIGLAAGFDKNGVLPSVLAAVGFGYAEIGSVTGDPCKGNAKPRLWRLIQSRGLVVYYGLVNDGAERVARRLMYKTYHLPLGMSIAKTNSPHTVPLSAGIADYIKAYTALEHIGSYDTLNISCPNAFGGEPFTDPYNLRALLQAIEPVRNTKPLFLKLSPDLSPKKVNTLVEIAVQYNVDGFICSNLTKRKKNPKIQEQTVPRHGGISGQPVKHLSNTLIRQIYKKTHGKKIIIGCGGIATAEDAYEKIRAGASLVQLITGMIFEGPQLISEIQLGLTHLLHKDGFTHISEAVGAEHRFLPRLRTHM